uniref:Uncharacterized protein n=1 Tax=Arundo donax TaxID=35708 RepID=A0A0A8Y626_ARUDO
MPTEMKHYPLTPYPTSSACPNIHALRKARPSGKTMQHCPVQM